MANEKLKGMHLSKITPAPYQTDEITLHFTFPDTDNVILEASYNVERNPDIANSNIPQVLELDYNDPELGAAEKAAGAKTKSITSLELDGIPLEEGIDFTYEPSERKLSIPLGSEERNNFNITVKRAYKPDNNTTGTGHYKSNGEFHVIKGETRNFMQLVPFWDRPDMLVKIKTTIDYDPENLDYNLFLSNGDKTQETDLPNGYKRIVYEDNEPKSCYLFGLQAGKFENKETSLTLSSGHKIKTISHVPELFKGKTAIANDGVHLALQWFEDAYGLTYPRDEYHTACVTVFNSGATEVKGMALFAPIYYATSPEYSSDKSIFATRSVTGHEYFHEFFGNRVYIRDWHHLGVKEGLVTYLENKFDCYLTCEEYARIDHIQDMLSAQYPSDDNPDRAKAVIPEFLSTERDHYTATTYSKGAECFNALEHILGEDDMTKFVGYYGTHYQGKACTIDDLLSAIEPATGIKLDEQFKLWFTQAGRPIVKARGVYDANKQTYTLTLEQSFKDHCNGNKPMMIPLSMALATSQGMIHEEDIVITARKTEHVFENVTEEPNAFSIHRGYTAPIDVDDGLDKNARLHLFEKETDGITKWLIAQDIHRSAILESYEELKQGKPPVTIDPHVALSIRNVLQEGKINKSTIARIMNVPTMSALGTSLDKIDPVMMHEARTAYIKSISTALYFDLETIYDSLPETSDDNVEQYYIRELRNTALSLLCRNPIPQTIERAIKHYNHATTGENRISGIRAINVALPNSDKRQYIDDFAQYMSNDDVGTQTSLSIAAAMKVDNPKAHLLNITNNKSSGFSWEIPHHITIVAAGFVQGNPDIFHAADSSGYRALKDLILEGAKHNPEQAAKVLVHLTSYKNFEEPYASRMLAVIEEIGDEPNLPLQITQNIKEVLSKQKNNLKTPSPLTLS